MCPMTTMARAMMMGRGGVTAGQTTARIRIRKTIRKTRAARAKIRQPRPATSARAVD